MLRTRRLAWGAATVAVLAAASAALFLSGLSLTLPRPLLERVETELSASLPRGRVEIGGMSMRLDREAGARIALDQVSLIDGEGLAIAHLGAIEIGLAVRPLLVGELLPTSLRVVGGEATLRRAADGSLSLALAGAARQRTPEEVTSALDAALSSGPLARLGRITGEALTISLEDARTGRVWQATDGALVVERRQNGLDVSVDAALFNGTDDLAAIRLTLQTDAARERARLGATVRDVPAADIALQSPALSWLGVLDAPISGALRGTIGFDGRLSALAATLEIGAGALRPDRAAPAVPFDGGKAYLSYDPERGAIRFDEVAVRTGLAEVAISGEAWLGEAPGGWPSSFTGQFRLERLALADGRALVPLALSGGAAVRLGLDPFRLDVAEAHLGQGGTVLRASGEVAAEGGAWSVAVDAGAERLAAATALAAWPPELARGPREWLARNLSAGIFRDVTAALRQRPGTPLALGVTASFEGAALRFLPEMPPIEQASGRLTYHDGALTVAITEGAVQAEGHGPVSAENVVVQLPDLRARPAPLAVDVQASGATGDVLAALQGAPVKLAERTGQGPDMATGTAEVRGRIELPLVRRPEPSVIRYDFDVALRDVASETLVAGRRLTAEELRLTVSPEGISVAGPVALDGVPADVRWTRGFGPDAVGSTVSGEIELSPEALAALGIELGAVEISGQAIGTLEVALAGGEPPELRLTSDIEGLRLALPALGWSKPASEVGRLLIEARLGPTPLVERLELAAAGLEAEGQVTLAEGGGLGEARFERLRVGDWLDASVRLRGRGAGLAPAVDITGGRVNLSRRPAASPGGGGGAAPLSLALDRLTVAGDIELAPFRAEVTTGGGGLSGAFSGRVGDVPVRGTLSAVPSGTAVRLASTDAGGALAASGVFDNLRGGALDLSLVPTGAPGSYEGRATITGTRLRNNAMAVDVLDAISIVGLLDQANGSGILFDQIDAEFRIEPGRVTIESLAATGASMGVSLDGVYHTAAEFVDFRGVVSPVYLLNGVGAALSRPGEGLFGIAFGLSGPAGSPSVQVNPLSVLAPGGLRDLFRRPPPR